MRRAFTLIDVLVTLGVIAVLLAILMPSLTGVRETARQVVCRSNIRQVGIGLGLYAENQQDKLPSSYFLTTSPQHPLETITLRRDVPDPNQAWDGAGRLYNEDYMSAAQIFYCPSHHGSHPFREYSDAWLAPSGELVGNYQYRGRGPLEGGNPPVSIDILSKMRSGATLLVDGLRTVSDFNHNVGANVFRADASVGWYADRAGNSILQNIPKNDHDQSVTPSPAQIDSIWQQIDENSPP